MVALRAKIVVTAAFVMAVAATILSFAQQPKARLAGLENNEEYMSLLREDADLSRRIDSLTTTVYTLREQLYRDEDGNRKERSSELLAMESDLYMLRGDRSRLVEQINTIEQEWLMANISQVPTPEDKATAEPQMPLDNGRQIADLIKNDYFSRSLSRSDYAALTRAQKDEKTAARLYSDFVKAHAELVAVRDRYDAAESESAADTLLSLLLSKQALCTTLSDSLDTTWSRAFDNKSYLYELLFDKEGREDMLDKAEKNNFTMRQGIAKESGRYASDAVVSYCFGRRCILDYETDMAQSTGLSAAYDSLVKVRSSLGNLRYDFAKISLKKRIFIEYKSIIFSTRYVYNSNNPVPECPVYEYGTVYRIKLGEFATQQPASKFKGLEPVSYLRTPSGGWRYYAGCYRSVDELENALKTVRRLGFTKADVAAWNDGAYADNREEVEELMSKRFSVEISGSDELSSSVREIIEEDGSNTGLTRTGRGHFTVGGLKSRDSAEILANAIAAADSSLSVTVIELEAAK